MRRRHPRQGCLELIRGSPEARPTVFSWIRVRPRLTIDWFRRRGFPGQAVDLADDAQHLFQLLTDLPHILQSGVGLVQFQQQQVYQSRKHSQGLGQAVQGLPDIPERI